MKICGNCSNEYDDKEVKCPVCGATMLKHVKGSTSAAAEYDRLKEEIARKRKNRSMILATGAAVIVLIVIIIISNIVNFFTDPQRAIAKESKKLLKQAEQMIDDGEYDSAIDVLDQISAEWEDYSKTNLVRQEAERGQLFDQIKEYQTAGDYEGVVAFIEENVSNFNADAEIQKIYAEAVQKCKEETLTTVNAYIQAADYIGAIQYINKLASDVKKDADIQTVYADAVDNYKLEAIGAAEKYAEVGDYTAAKSVLTVAENYIGSDNDISNKLSEINQREVLATVLEYETAGNYQGAITYMGKMSSVVSSSAELQAKLNTYKEKYRADIIVEAANAYGSDGYQAAVNVLAGGLKVLANDAILIEQKEKYENLAPVSLLDLDTFYSDYGDDSVWSNKRIVQVMKDKLGNTYENCIEYQYGGKDARDIYIINGEYTSFTGTIFVPDHRKSNYDDWTYNDPFYFYIYGDGKLLYRSPKMLSTQYPADFKVDISGVKELAICWHGGATTWYYEIGLANAYLYKD